MSCLVGGSSRPSWVTLDVKKGSGRLRGSILGALGSIFASPGLLCGCPGLPDDPSGAAARIPSGFVCPYGIPRGPRGEKYTPTGEQNGAKMIPQERVFYSIARFLYAHGIHISIMPFLTLSRCFEEVCHVGRLH